MISVQEAKAIILEKITHLESKFLLLNEAAGLTLAQDVYAELDIPNFVQSSVDGYALKLADKDFPWQIIGEMAAGEAHQMTINTGQASRIFTGAPLPIGADTVVMQEKVIVENKVLTIKDNTLKQGDNVRAKGAEIKNGALAMQKGESLTAAALGFLAGIGIDKILVYPPPEVILIITGKEIQQPGTPLTFGQVYDANSIMLRTALKQSGIPAIKIMYADDDLSVLQQILADALLQSDLVLLAGGISVGDYDFVLPATQYCGVQQHFHKVKQKPGKPLFFGTKGRKIVFGLPGNPSSALTCFYEYVLLAIDKVLQRPDSLKITKGRMGVAYNKAAGLTHFLKGTYVDGIVKPLAAQESFRLASYAQANCLICLDEDVQQVDAMDEVEVHLITNL